MRFKRSQIILVMIICVFVLSEFYYTSDYPNYEIFDGPTYIDGSLAYKELESFIERFPNRYVGTENNLLSAKWIEEYFLDLGFDVHIQEFQTNAPDGGVFLDLENMTRDYSSDINHNAYNVIGTLKGRLNKAIVIGAHRDTIGTIEGAEDNGSGTILMLHLARILSKHDLNYTYIFVSFDAEEIGLRGSEKFAKEYRYLDILMAVSIDMVGWKGANTVSFYPFTASGNRTELWLYALSRQIVGEESFSYPERTNILFETLKLVVSSVPTDSEPFIRRGIPGLGVYVNRIGARNFVDGRNIHNTLDTMEQISGDSIEMAGQFMERLIYTIEGGLVNTGFTSMYIPRRNKLVPPWYLYLYYSVITFFLYCLAIFDVSTLGSILDKPIDIIKGEVKYFIAILIFALGIALYWAKFILASFSFMNAPNLILSIIGLLMPFIILGVLVLTRSSKTQYTNPADGNRLALTVFLIIIFTFGILMDYYRTVLLLLLPIMLFIYFNSTTKLRFISIFPLLAFFPIMLILLSAQIFFLYSIKTTMFLFIFFAFWLVSGVYFISKPQRY